jgi:hypothetical protein
MNTLTKLEELSLRLDHLDNTGEWLSEALAGKDDVVAQSGKLVCSIVEDVRYRLLELVTELEKEIAVRNQLSH